MDTVVLQLCLNFYYISLLFYLSNVLLCYRNFMFSPDVPIRLDYHGKKWVDREHVSSEISRVLVRYFFFILQKYIIIVHLLMLYLL